MLCWGTGELMGQMCNMIGMDGKEEGSGERVEVVDTPGHQRGRTLCPWSNFVEAAAGQLTRLKTSTLTGHDGQ